MELSFNLSSSKLKTHNSLLQTLNSIRNTQYSILFFILIICQLSTVNGQLSFAAGNLEVEGELEINSTASDNRSGIVLQPLSAVPVEPSPQVKGEFYHNDTTGPWYYDGNSWKSIGGGAGSGKDKRVATKIVAVKRNPPDPALDSLDASRADIICDGINDQVEIQQAIDALGTKGGEVYLLEGTYNISVSITITKSNISLIGTGKATILKRAWDAGSYAGVITVGDGGITEVKGITITNLQIDGARTIYTGLENVGIYFKRKVLQSKIRNTMIYNCDGRSIYLYATSSTDSNFCNIIEGNEIRNNRQCIWLEKSSNNIVTGNNIQGNVETALTVAYSSLNNNISNNIFRDNGVGISLSVSSNNNTINGNILSNKSANIGIANGSSNNAITGNTCFATTNLNQAGIYIYDNANCNTVTGNICKDNAGPGIHVVFDSNNNIVTGNIVYNNALNTSVAWNKAGILIQESDNNLICSNRIKGHDYGINLFNNAGSMCDNNYLIGNYVEANSQTIRDPSGHSINTKYTQKEKITIERQAVFVPGSGGTLNVSTNPKSYLPLAPASAVTLNTTTAINDGKSIGDMLILEGTSNTNTVTIEDNANVQLASTTDSNSNGTNDRVLGLEDTLKLFWNGSGWIEIAFSNN